MFCSRHKKKRRGVSSSKTDSCTIKGCGKDCHNAIKPRIKMNQKDPALSGCITATNECCNAGPQ